MYSPDLNVIHNHIKIYSIVVPHIQRSRKLHKYLAHLKKIKLIMDIKIKYNTTTNVFFGYCYADICYKHSYLFYIESHQNFRVCNFCDIINFKMFILWSYVTNFVICHNGAHNSYLKFWGKKTLSQAHCHGQVVCLCQIVSKLAERNRIAKHKWNFNIISFSSFSSWPSMTLTKQYKALLVGAWESLKLQIMPTEWTKKHIHG